MTSAVSMCNGNSHHLSLERAWAMRWPATATSPALSKLSTSSREGSGRNCPVAAQGRLYEASPSPGFVSIHQCARTLALSLHDLCGMEFERTQRIVHQASSSVIAGF